MYTSCVCISPCRYKDYVFKVGHMYFLKEVINYKNELTEMAIYSELDLGENRAVKTFIGYLKVNFTRCNFMNFGNYCMLLNEIDKNFEKVLWDI